MSIPEAARFGTVTDSNHVDEATGLEASKHLRVGHVMGGGVQQAHIFNNHMPGRIRATWACGIPVSIQAGRDSMRETAFGCGVRSQKVSPKDPVETARWMEQTAALWRAMLSDSLKTVHQGTMGKRLAVLIWPWAAPRDRPTCGV